MEVSQDGRDIPWRSFTINKPCSHVHDCLIGVENPTTDIDQIKLQQSSFVRMTHKEKHFMLNMRETKISHGFASLGKLGVAAGNCLIYVRIHQRCTQTSPKFLTVCDGMMVALPIGMGEGQCDCILNQNLTIMLPPYQICVEDNLMSSTRQSHQGRDEQGDNWEEGAPEVLLYLNASNHSNCK